jgi:eukaryotic-like serine/threonine-protein kinase
MAAGDELVGKVIGECQIERVLARGGMSIAFTARHRHLDVRVVVKVLDPKRAWGRPALVEAFLREAKALAVIQHPNVVRIFSAGMAQESESRFPYLVLDWVPGGSVRALLRERRPEYEEAVELLIAAGEGLGAAHARGVAHGDIKPENLLLDAEGRVKVVDFGLAQVAGEAAVEGLATYGTPAYMAPERCRGGAPDAPSDVYALGVTLYEALLDRWPFNAPEPRLLLKKHLDEPVPLDDLREVVPEPLVRFIDRCLAKEPAERPPNGAAFARLLREAATAPTESQVVRRRKRRRGAMSSPAIKAARRERGSGSSALVVGMIVALCAAALLLLLVLRR